MKTKEVIALLRKQANKHAKVVQDCGGSGSYIASWHAGARDALRAAATKLHRMDSRGSE